MVVADPQKQRRTVARGHELVGVAAGYDSEAVGAIHLRQRGGDGILQVPVEGLVDQVREDLGIGLAAERVAQLLELPPQDRGVLDDPVVDDGDLAAAIVVRVRVRGGRGAVGRPARMGQTERSVRQVPFDRFRQLGDLARHLSSIEAPVGADGDSRRVVAPILQPPQTLQQQRGRLPIAYISNDAAHVIPCVPPR